MLFGDGEKPDGTILADDIARPPDSTGVFTAAEERVASQQIAAGHARNCAVYNIYACICGLNEMVSANRDSLKTLGWERKRIIFEGYD